MLLFDYGTFRYLCTKFLLVCQMYTELYIYFLYNANILVYANTNNTSIGASPIIKWNCLENSV